MSGDLTQLANYADALDELHKVFTPHAKQLEPARDLFFGGTKDLFLCLGRRSGKSSLMCYFAVRWALTRARSQIYIVAPQLNSGREIMLASGLLPNMVPRKYFQDHHKAEGRVTLTNGSFIRIMGADDPDTLRGIKCSLLLVDEVKDLKPEVLDILSPTRIDEDAPQVLSGTPPETAEHSFWELVKTAKETPGHKYYHGTSYDNPHLKKELIDKERAKFEKRGDLDVFMREYMAQYVPGGKRAVFPMLTDEHFVPYAKLYGRIYRNQEQWKFYCTLDPGTAACFAAGVFAVNPYKGLVYFMDEVYEQQQAETSIGRIWPKIKARMRELYWPERTTDEQWTVTVDEAASWARNELLDQFDTPSFPTTKAQHRKSDGISLIKDLLRTHKLVFSDRIVSARREMLAYMLDKQGNYVKKDDHQIDVLRYTLAAAHYTFNETDAPQQQEELPEDERKAVYTIEDDMRAEFGELDEPYMLDFIE